jgi:hypothetical protein
MTGQKIKAFIFLLLFLTKIGSLIAQDKKEFAIGISSGYYQDLEYRNGLNYNLFFEGEINPKFLFQINAFWMFHESFNDIPNSNIANLIYPKGSIRVKTLNDQTAHTGIDLGLGYKLLATEKWNLLLALGANYSRLTFNQMLIKEVPDSFNPVDSSNEFGLYAQSYNKNRIGYYGSLSVVRKISEKIQIGPEIKWRGFPGQYGDTIIDNGIPSNGRHPVLTNGFISDILSVNLKILVKI